jgi:hypothetical protein
LPGIRTCNGPMAHWPCIAATRSGAVLGWTRHSIRATVAVGVAHGAIPDRDERLGCSGSHCIRGNGCGAEATEVTMETRKWRMQLPSPVHEAGDGFHVADLSMDTDPIGVVKPVPDPATPAFHGIGHPGRGFSRCEQQPTPLRRQPRAAGAVVLWRLGMQPNRSPSPATTEHNPRPRRARSRRA